MTLIEVSRQLNRVGSSSPDLDGRLLLELVSGESGHRILAETISLSREQQQQLKTLIQARADQPLAYLIGEREFYSHKFLVNPDVLVPRPESEALIELSQELGPHPAVYDLGCGSGCLGLAYQLSHRPPAAALYLIDSSGPALTVARQNARRLGCSARSWQKSIADLSPRLWQAGSLILANLPYLDRQRADDYYHNCPDLKAEPTQALFSHDRGLGCYRQLWPRLGSRPRHLILEADPDQHSALIDDANRVGWQLVGRLGLGLAFKSPAG